MFKHSKIQFHIGALIIASCVLLALTVILLYVFIGRREGYVDLSDYVAVNFIGVDGNGSMRYTVDTQGLNAALSQNEKNALALKKIAAVVEDIIVSGSKESHISNGEELEITIHIDKDTLNKLDVKVKGTSFRVNASGLAQGDAIDIFENVEVTVAGISPRAYATVVNQWEDENFGQIPFSLDKVNNIAKGDVLTVTCEADDDTLAALGLSASDCSKEYKVETVDVYVSDVSGLDKDVLSNIRNEAEGLIVSETADMTFRMLYKATKDSAFLFQHNNETAQNLTFLDAAFLYRKNPAEEGVMNYIYLFEKADISNGTSVETVYFAFELTEAVRTVNNGFSVNASDLKNKYICGTDYNDMYSRLVLSKENSFTIHSIQQE